MSTVAYGMKRQSSAPMELTQALRSSRPLSSIEDMTGDVVDLTTVAGRDQLLERLRNGDSDFVAKVAPGKIAFGYPERVPETLSSTANLLLDRVINLDAHVYAKRRPR